MRKIPWLYAVTRQCYWPDGTEVVEIAVGGSDYTNPDALGVRYPELGEGEEFEDPRDAVQVARRIALRWRKDDPDHTPKHLAFGYTHGDTLPFEPTDLGTARRWAERQWEQIPKCDGPNCTRPLAEGRYTIHSDPDLGQYCSEQCAEAAYIASFTDPDAETIEA